MQHEMMRPPAPAFGSENVGDVLASIRRLIAQDEAGCRLSGAMPAVAPEPVPEPAAPPQEAPRIGPLVLDSNDLIASAPVAMKIAVEPAMPAAESGTAASAVGTVAASPWLVAEPFVPSSAAIQQSAEIPGASFEPVADTADGETPAVLTSDASHEAPATTTVRMEETMLHANTTVTPINPAVEAAAEAAPRQTGEMHLFAPEEKGAKPGNHLRGMIREAIRQELQGEIGDRMSRNLQAMIRQEIELTLRQMCEQD